MVNYIYNIIMKKILLISLSIIASYYVQAQTQDKKWNIGLHAGVGQYKGDLGNDFYKTDMPLYGFGGITFSRYIGGHLDFIGDERNIWLQSSERKISQGCFYCFGKFQIQYFGSGLSRSTLSFCWRRSHAI